MAELVPWSRHGTRAVAQRGQDPFLALRQEFDALFDRVMGSMVPTQEEGSPWGLELTPGEKEVVVRAEAPGFEAGDFDVRVTADSLHIVAEKKSQEEKDGGAFSRSARLERWVPLPPGLDTDKVEATYKNGVLELHLPRNPEAAGRKIAVKS